jgi:hypothetical protein
LSKYESQISGFREIRLSGDITNDGAVNMDDVHAFNAAFGQVGTNLAADFNNDNMVNLEDFAILRGNFGMISGSGVPGGLSPAPVPAPEPATMFVLFSAVPLLLKSRKRRRKA